MEQGTIVADRYELKELLGQGGMGAVYRGYDIVLDRPVAIKLLASSGIGTDGKARFLREARAAARLNHPHIVATYDAGESASTAYIVMELVEGQTLRDYQGSLQEKLSIIRQIGEALVHAHEHHIIHRDLKPENVMITSEGTAKLLDFGLALAVGLPRFTQEGAAIGTLFYLAPEMIMGKEATAQSDLYALGVIIYELTTGRHPFIADNLIAVISQHLNAPVVPPSTYNAEIPPLLEQMILKLLNKTPEARIQSAQEVLEVIESIGAEASGVIQEPLAVVSTGSSSSLLLDRIVRGRLVGRREELNELRQFWHRAEDGHGHLVLVSGEPGLGKTRLAQELAVYARLRGALLLEGAFHPELGVTYLGIREAIRNHLRGQTPEIACAHIGDNAAELVKLLPEVASIVGEIAPNPPLGDANVERLRLFDHITQFLMRRAEEKPLLLILEDLHWADQPSLLFLHYFLRQIQDAPVLVVGTYREVQLEPARPFYETLVGLNRERLYSRIILHRLEFEEVSALLHVLLDGQVDTGLARAIDRETEGNPFFVEEVLKALIEEGALRKEREIWIATEGLKLIVPQSIQIAIGKRLESLGETAQDVLSLASVLGREFDVDVLLGMQDWDEDQLLDALDEAEGAQLIVPAEANGGDRYRFSHALLAQVLYEAINTRRRARFHQRAGESFEKVCANRLDDCVEELAYHFSHARTDAASKTVTYSLKAAEKAVAVYAHDQAIRLYQIALEALADLHDVAREAQVWEMLGDVQFASYRRVDMHRSYQNGLEAFQRAAGDQGEDLRRLLLKAGQQLARDGLQLDQAQDYLERALSLIPDQGAEEERSRCQAALAICAAQKADLPAALEQATTALDMAQSAGSTSDVANAYGALCVVYREYDNLEAYLDAAIKQAEALEGSVDLFTRFNAYWNAGVAAWLRGHYQEAEALASASHSVSEQLNVPGWETLTLAAYSGILGDQGRWDEALANADRVLPLFRQIGADSCFCYIFANLAKIEAKRGVPASARRFIVDSQDIFRQLGESDTDPGILRWRFFGHVYLEEWEDAWNVVEEWRAQDKPLVGVTPVSFYLWSSMLPEAAARTGHFEETFSLAQEVLKLAGNPALPPLVAACHFAMGVAYAGQESWDEALNELGDALTRYQALGRPWDIGNTNYELALVYRRRDAQGDMARAQECFAEALTRFDALGAQPGIARVQEAMT